MSDVLKQRDFLKEIDFTRDELQHCIDLAAELKAGQACRHRRQRHLAGRSIALIFEKTSTRTRCAFEVAAYDQGAHVTYLDPSSSQIGHKESAADTARVLSRMFDAIEFRGKAQATVEELAEHADVPVYNGLTDEWHPTQMLADFLTMEEHAGGRTTEVPVLLPRRRPVQHGPLPAGDGRRSWARTSASAHRKDLWPDAEVQAIAREHAERSPAPRITLTEDLDEGLRGAEFVHTDVWVSMGEPNEVWESRVRELHAVPGERGGAGEDRQPEGQVHALPARVPRRAHTVGREVAELTGVTGGLEVTDEVFRSPANIAFDQAENRLHTIKALMVATLRR